MRLRLLKKFVSRVYVGELYIAGDLYASFLGQPYSIPIEFPLSACSLFFTVLP